MKLRIRIRHYCTALGRLHRSHGHGIHSPFAFRFARDILREGAHCRYYAEAEVIAERRRLKRAGMRGLPPAAMLRRLHRVAATVQPARTVILGPSEPLLQLALTTACTAPLLHDTTPHGDDLVVITQASSADPQSLTEAMRDRGTIYITDLRPGDTSALFTRLRTALPHAQTFTNDREAVMVSRPDFSPQSYSLWF